jgi:hypothetical protein
LPLPARDYQGLVTGKAGTFFLLENIPRNRNGKRAAIGGAFTVSIWTNAEPKKFSTA